MFNFFQKKNKDNRPDGYRDSKEKIPEKSSAFSGSKKSEISESKKTGDLAVSKKTANSPQKMIFHISEKSSNLTSQNSHVFKVEKNLNKMIVKKIIESHYGVKVASVKILNLKPKKRMRGNIAGKKPGYKKAIVQLKEGSKIEI
ncbi:MAG: 50S ribosomal protein L23 [Patescibacteria group bacterium]